MAKLSVLRPTEGSALKGGALELSALFMDLGSWPSNSFPCCRCKGPRRGMEVERNIKSMINNERNFVLLLCRSNRVLLSPFPTPRGLILNLSRSSV